MKSVQNKLCEYKTNEIRNRFSQIILKMASKHHNRAAGDIVPPLRKVNSLQALMRLRPKRGCEWGVLAFSLNRDMIQPDGTLDDLHGVVFSLGSFDEVEKAEEHAKKIIEITGHPAVIPVRYGYPLRLSPKFDPAAVTEVPVDIKGRLINLESAQYKREQEEYELRIKQEREMIQEAEEESNPDSIEHFKRQCFLAIKNRSKFQLHSKEADTAWADYKKREAAVREHYARHPEHETQWLKYLKTKLKERGEISLYYAMREAYKELREELLGLAETSDEESTSSPVLSTMQNNSAEVPVTSEECPGGVCFADSSSPVPSEECPGGVCFADPSSPVPSEECLDVVKSDTASDDDIMSPEDFASHKQESPVREDIEVSSVKTSGSEDHSEDDIIAATEIPAAEDPISSPVEEDIVVELPKEKKMPAKRGGRGQRRGRR
jgi:hypothetical protein